MDEKTIKKDDVKKDDTEDRKKIVLKLMEEGQRLSLEMQKDKALYERIKELSNY